MDAPIPPFDAAAWIGTGKSICDAPRAVLDAAAAALAIPAHYAGRLPPSTLSVQELARLNLPTVFTRTPAGLTAAELFINGTPSASLDSAILSYSLLPVDFLSGLAGLAAQAWLDGKLLRHPCSRDILPLWVIQLWLALHPACLAREKWISAMQWLEIVQQRCRPGDIDTLRSCITHVQHLLQVTPWGADLSNVHVDLAMDLVPRLLADGVIGSYEINGMIATLRSRLPLFVSDSTDIEILDLITADALWKLGSPSEISRYPKAGTYKYLRELGSRITAQRTSRVLLPYHLGATDHWAACEIRRTGAATVSISSGDSLGYRLPSHLRNGIAAWVQALGLVVSPEKVMNLPHGMQDDTISCAIACINTIEHAVFGVPLFQHGTRDVFRIAKFVEMLEAHHSGNTVSQLPMQLWNRGATDLRDTAVSDPVPPGQPDSLECMPSAGPSAMASRALAGATTSSGSPPTTGGPAAALLSVQAAETSTASRTAPPSMLPDRTHSASLAQSDADRERPGFQGPPHLLLGPPAHRSAPATQQSKLSFKPLTAEEKRLLREREAAEAASRREAREQALQDHRWRQVQADEKKALDRRIANRESVRNHRERQRQSEIAQGLRPAQGRKPRAKKSAAPAAKPDAMLVDAPASAEPLPARDPSSSTDSSFASRSTTADPALELNIAQLSRPYRMFKQLPKEKKLSGRPQTKPVTAATRTNWQSPILWLAIDEAAHRNGFRPSATVTELKVRHPQLYAGLRASTLGEWVHRSLGEPTRWKDTVLERAGKGYKVGGDPTRVGILAKYPEVTATITKRLKLLREAGVPLSIYSIRGMVQGMLTHLAPEVFEIRTRDGQTFSCSDAWIRSFLHNSVGFSPRRPTRAAQKVPVDAPQLGDKLFLRFVYLCEQLFILAAFGVNTDQTQSVFAYGTSLTWSTTGEKQVSVVGQEEKRAFTLNVGVSMDGVLLPFQAIYSGKSARSLPRATAPGQDRARELGFLFEYSNTDTYWSTQATMRSYVTNILAPYFERRRVEFGRPETQEFLWELDCWSVHKSVEFRTWMRTNHPRIRMVYVPAGCTGLYQPCDVGIQRVLKHALKHASHVDIVAETIEHLQKGVAAEAVHLDSRIGTLRDRSVLWLLKAFDACNNTELVQKAWSMCAVGPHNLSFSDITSRSALERLRALPRTMPDFWAELSSGAERVDTTVEADPLSADQTLDDETDDTAVPTADVIQSVLGHGTGRDLAQHDGYLHITSTAESELPGAVFGDSGSEPADGGGNNTEADGSDSEKGGDEKCDLADEDFDPGKMKLGASLPREASARSRRAPGWYKEFNKWAL